MSDPPILDVAILGRFFCTSYLDRYKSRFCSGKRTDRGKWIFEFRTPEKNGTKPDKVRNEKWIMSDPPILDVAILGRFLCFLP